MRAHVWYHSYPFASSQRDTKGGTAQGSTAWTIGLGEAQTMRRTSGPTHHHNTPNHPTQNRRAVAIQRARRMRRARRSRQLVWAGTAVAAGGAGVLLLFLLLPEPSTDLAQGDISGPACIEDGDTLHINGKRSYGECRNGHSVVLYGIDAPELKQDCHHQGTDWACGRQAASTLLHLTRDKTVTCVGNSHDADGSLIAVCHVDGQDLNELMVRMGMAISVGSRYALEEGAARTAHAGIWMGAFDRPADWRAAH